MKSVDLALTPNPSLLVRFQAWERLALRREPPQRSGVSIQRKPPNRKNDKTARQDRGEPEAQDLAG
jgi:hypothetical protein